jgi:hypothetical protein
MPTDIKIPDLHKGLINVSAKEIKSNEKTNPPKIIRNIKYLFSLISIDDLTVKTINPIVSEKSNIVLIASESNSTERIGKML